MTGGIPMRKIDYHVIATGSTGNAVRIEKIMIDCGIPFKEMKEDLYLRDTLLITHAHSDHVKASTLKSIRKDFPRIAVYANADVAYRYDVDHVVGTTPFSLSHGRRIVPFEGRHNVPVTGYLIEEQGINILYATDTCQVILPENVPIDYCFLESNYDERKLQEIGKRYARGRYDPAMNAHRHLSTQKCTEFYYVHRRSAESKLIELHQSKRFY